MGAIEAGTRLTLKNILFLTDFSEPSEVAIPFAVALAREYEAKVCALHVLTPVPLAYASPESTAAAIEGLEEGAQVGMQRLDSQLAGVDHETLIIRGESVWTGVEHVLAERDIDLLIVGTHGRIGAIKLLLGSVAEDCSPTAYKPRTAPSTSLSEGGRRASSGHGAVSSFQDYTLVNEWPSAW